MTDRPHLTAGRKQVDHKYLYWKLGSQSAVRMGHWKSVGPRSNAPWELYDLKNDISETHNVATDNPKILNK